MRLKYILIFFAFSVALLCNAQVLTIDFDREKIADDAYLVKVYMNSAADTTYDIRAVNFSMALDTSCTQVELKKAIFTELWTPLAEKSVVQGARQVTYGEKTYHNRYLYAIAELGLPTTKPISLPAKGDDGLLVLELLLTGTCTQNIYFEDESEYRANQMGSVELRPVPYLVKREMAERKSGD